ncbi:carboxypeptidase regulatory-like domain-containing protein [Micromonospora auratinigra]|uniref:alpha-amylase n=1 Tax=Micromonospora auratinigra TaxID=261654 RepID=A0A1A8ZZY1_9ACTN|nr:carboxypeptidase regulatory-like domain-containing protein [Micromonospora auratinigra]SBT49455.1 Carboxypeptidase regulatory-like domain-containing protein [Micromonospora auratinigra]
MRLSLVRRAALAAVVTGAVVLPGATPALAADTGTVSGRLTSSNGTGAADVPVQVWGNGGAEVSGSTTTDADGRYSVDGLTAGDYIVAFLPPERPQQFYRQKTQAWEADRVTVDAGGTTTADDQLVATGVLTGQLQGTAGAYVEAQNQDTWETVAATTDDTGHYRLYVVPGTYVLSFRPVEGSWQSQYVPGTLDPQSAGRYQVAADQTVTVNDTVLGVGSLSGQLTSATGAPVPNASVIVNTATSSSGGSATTDANGEFTVPALLSGGYKVGFFVDGREQYHPGRSSWDTAGVVTVTGGQQTRITERLLGTGSIRVSAVDSVTGAPVSRFCVNSADRCTDGTGTVTLTGLPEGSHDLLVFAPDNSYFTRQVADVRVRADRTTPLTVKLRAGAVVTTTVVDRVTGEPLPDVCVSGFLPKRVTFPENNTCTDATGKVRVGPLATGTYRLFVTPRDREYGRQWVGAEGGTGDERQAVQVEAVAGTVVAGPSVRLDRAGTISGTVRDAVTGAPARSVDVSVLTGVPYLGLDDASTDAEGRYTLSGLGPYAWPVMFAGHPYATVWSGGATSRYTATPVQVTAGGQARLDTVLRSGTEVTGTVTDQDGTPFGQGWVTVRNADTGDMAGFANVEDGRYTIRALGRQRVYLTYSLRRTGGDTTYAGTYKVTGDDGTSRVALFTVPSSGTLAVDLVVPTS